MLAIDCLWLDKITKCVLNVIEKQTLYVFIGATGYYNAIKERSSSNDSPDGSGGSTDVRLNATDNWYDQKSLVSRIMVAAGGGSVEWRNSVGGNGGTIEGGQSLLALGDQIDSPLNSEPCLGANQTTSQECPSITIPGSIVDGVVYEERTHYATPGGFGYAGNPSGNDIGGFGGNGYYGGTSYQFAFAGSGGSSFISGHQGCKAIEKP